MEEEVKNVEEVAFDGGTNEGKEESKCTGEKPMCPTGSRCVCGSNNEWTCEGVA